MAEPVRHHASGERHHRDAGAGRPHYHRWRICRKPRDQQFTGQLRQFVLTAAAASGATQLSIYPAIVPELNGQPVQYQTVIAAPANAAAISLVTQANSTYAKNIAFYPQAITMATADPWTPTQGVVEAARDNYDGVSMRMLTAYMPGSDQAITRSDGLWGFLFICLEWCCLIADTIS